MVVRISRRLLRLSASVVMAVGGLVAATAVPAAAHPGVPSSRFDPNVVQWGSYRNYSPSEFGTIVTEQRGAGRMLIDIDIDAVGSSSVLGGVFQRNLDGRDWFYLRDLTDGALPQVIEEFRRENMRLVDLEPYIVNGTHLWGGVWVENVEGYAWDVIYNAPSYVLEPWSVDERAAGRMLVDVDVSKTISTNQCCLFSAISVRNAESLNWTLVLHRTSSEFNAVYNALRSTHRPLVADSSTSPTGQRFSGVWVENRNGRDWTILRGMTLDEWAARWQEQSDAGKRVINYERYQTDDGTRYLGIWRQNS
jgi:hypothetical protein